MTMPCASINCKLEFPGQQQSSLGCVCPASRGRRLRSNVAARTVVLRSLVPTFLAFLLTGLATVTRLEAEVAGRVTYRDGSPCTYCWLQVQTGEGGFKVRSDARGYFEFEVSGPDVIQRLRARDLGGESFVEDGFLFFTLHKDNPQLTPVIKELRKRLQTYQVYSNSALVQQVIAEDCYFIVEREMIRGARVSRFRSVEVDLSQLELLEACDSAGEEACVRLQPARVVGESNRLDGGGGAVFFNARHKENVPAVLHSIALLARACGNLKTRVSVAAVPPSGPPR